MKFIGIDLAWTYTNFTGVCVLEDKKAAYLAADLFSDDDLISMILDNSPCIVSVDAPLVVKNETGGRSVDSLLMKTRINGRYLKLYATSRTYMIKTFNALRGEDIYLRLKDAGFIPGADITETFPTGIFLSLFPDIYDDRYKISSGLKLDKLKHNSLALIDRLKETEFKFDLDPADIITKKKYKLFEDRLDSLMCAVNSYYLYHDKCRIWKDDSGFISLPTES